MAAKEWLQIVKVYKIYSLISLTQAFKGHIFFTAWLLNCVDSYYMHES